MILPIYVYGSEVLRESAKEADLNEKEELTRLIADMKETLAKAEGCGLAAPQVGKSLRVLIADGSEMVQTYPYLKGFERVMINPRVVSQSSDTVEYEEGCLSVPGIYANVRRPSSVTVEYWNEKFEKVTETFDKFGSRIIQHELSHLDGDLFVDRVAPVRKKIISKKLQNIARGKASARYSTILK